jgi:Na+-transporting NADH:ubiquinone oxidoreductase subunit B
MRRVLLALLPIYLFSIYLYGWRLLLLGAIVFTVGIGIEFLMERTRKKRVSEAVLVTCSLFLLGIPAQTPWWIAIIGIAFSIFIAKEVYGGFGRNIFNPAISGRLFIYITFPNQLQAGYFEPGNFGFGVDTITTATPLELLRQGQPVDYLKLLLGLRPGSMGESSIILIFLAAVYLIVTKTASWRLIVSTFLSAAILTFALHLFGVAKALPPGALLAGSIFFVSVFYATDPVSGAKKNAAQWLYGAIIGSTTILIRTFSLFPEGTSFGVMLGNTFASLLDHLVTKKKPKAEVKGAKA